MPAGHVTDRLKHISRQVAFSCEFLKLRKVLSKLMNLAAALRDQISQSPQNEITFGTEAFQLPFVRYSLIAQDLEDLSNFLKDLPGQTSALFALLKRFKESIEDFRVDRFSTD